MGDGFRLFRPDHGGDFLVTNHLLKRLANRLLDVRVLDRRDVTPKRRIQKWSLVCVELKRHRDVERDRLPFLAVDVDLVVVRRAFVRGLRQDERLHEDGILLDARR